MYKNYLLSLFLIAVPLHGAAEVERSVDKDGNVTFSDKPVQGSVSSERIGIDSSSPSPDRLNESVQESQDIIDKARRSQQKRDSINNKNNGSNQSVEEARKQLEESKVVREGDRRGTARGGSRLTPEYQERVKAAERNLEQIQKNTK